jgi:hypothetical protein
MERLIQSPDEGVMPQKDAPLSGLPTQVGTSDGWDCRPESGLPTYVGTSDGQDCWPELGLPTHVGTCDGREC